VLKPTKFRPFEKRILWIITLFLIGAGTVGVSLAVQHGNWRMLIASVGVLGLGVIYVVAARRGKPL
jgi:hypothetical protein